MWIPFAYQNSNEDTLLFPEQFWAPKASGRNKETAKGNIMLECKKQGKVMMTESGVLLDLDT